MAVLLPLVLLGAAEPAGAEAEASVAPGDYATVDLSDDCVWPSDMVLSGGWRWITCLYSHQIVRVSPNGDTTVFSSPEMESPGGILAVGANIYYTTIGNTPGIGWIDPFGGGGFVGFPSGSWPTDLTVGPDGKIWVVDSGQRRLVAFDPATHRLTAAPLPPNTPTPTHITTGPDGALWFLLLGGGAEGQEIGRMTTAGIFSSYTVRGVIDPGAILRLGSSLWVGGAEGIAEFSPTLKRSTRWFVGTNATALARGADGLLWYASTSQEGIGRLNPMTGGHTVFPYPHGPLAAPALVPEEGGSRLAFVSAFDNHFGTIQVTPGSGT